MPISFWRSSDPVEQLNRLDRPGFAIEFLRRNVGYRSDYTRTLRQRPLAKRPRKKPLRT